MPPELPLTKPTWESDVQASQSDYFMQHGKYQQFSKDAIAPNSEVYEYVGPKGPGYVLYEYYQKGDVTYWRGINHGPEDDQGFDWTLYYTKTPTWPTV
jgi:hypothetical protein